MAKRDAISFSLSADYFVDPAAAGDDLRDSARCLLGSALHIMEEKADDFDESMYGALYQLRQASATLRALVERREVSNG